MVLTQLSNNVLLNGASPRRGDILKKASSGKIFPQKYMEAVTPDVRVLVEPEDDRLKCKKLTFVENEGPLGKSAVVITPDIDESVEKNKQIFSISARRSLVPRTSKLSGVTVIPDPSIIDPEKKRNKKFPTSTISVPPHVKKVYSIINKKTGSIGGNGSGGAIYGELTVGSMQKMVDVMKEHTGLNAKSRFIDVGCGLGKPSIHVAQDPRVEFSYGIEMEKVRWQLGMVNLHHVLKEAKKDEEIGFNCMLDYGDITEATTFDPFTHVYMFDIGFPPPLFLKLAKMFKDSGAQYLISYQPARKIIDQYKFNVELIHRLPTSMHGSSETHSGYIYRKIVTGNTLPKFNPRLCDNRFKEAFKRATDGLDPLIDHVKEKIDEGFESGRPRRTRTKRLKTSNSIATRVF